MTTGRDTAFKCRHSEWVTNGRETRFKCKKNGSCPFFDTIPLAEVDNVHDICVNYIQSDTMDGKPQTEK